MNWGRGFLLLSLVLSGCGFQLRGAMQLPRDVALYVEAAQAPQTGALLSQSLQEQGVVLASTAAKAGWVLHLTQETITRRVLSVSAFSGKMEEIELSHGLDFSVNRPDGTVLLAKQPVRFQRELSFDVQAVLAKDNEEQLLRQDMQREVVAQVLRQLSVLSQRPAP